MPIDIQRLLAVAGGEIVGKVRLQKVVYLLDQMGMRSGLSFSYHHYGPYSAQLTNIVDDAVAFEVIEEESKRRASDGVPYSVFRAVDDAVPMGDEPIGELAPERLREALQAMNSCTATVLEIAATIHWLANVEHIDDWQKELVARKGLKADPERTKRALELLRDLGLEPAVQA